jgi:hypothetical protein
MGKLMLDSAAIQRLDESIQRVQESRQPTIDAIVEEKRQREAQAAAEEQKRQRVAEKSTAKEGEDGQVQDGEGEMEGLEEEADQQGAFNPETGEINWDGTWSLWGGVQGGFQLLCVLKRGAEGRGVHREVQVS